MDVLAGLLDGPRARGAFLLRMVMRPPWSVRVEDEATLCVLCMTKGEAWIIPDVCEPVLLRPGDVAIVRGPGHYTTADRADREPTALIGPGGTCHTLQGEPLAESMSLGVRSWGNDPAGSSTMLVGTYQMKGEVSTRLLDALPDVVHLSAETLTCPLMPVLDEEISRDEPGQSVMLDRILDLVLVAALRTWFSRPDAAAPAWYRAMGDPVVGQALRLMQDDPSYPWTVASIADKCGVSRAGLARRFTDLVGEPPMAYLTGLRLALAADLLRDTDATVEAVARKVGYSGSFALSAAFKRVRGISPQEHRTGQAPANGGLPKPQQHSPEGRSDATLEP
ncbi:AraC family transcriptional regulator [Streptomyces sp. NPDC051907]|uniref:AraC family transcriptional regulator n=1 Tax=Streptomyces sp. NPDC051907 TaxID=3155284 RepID=UPI00343B02B0